MMGSTHDIASSLLDDRRKEGDLGVRGAPWSWLIASTFIQEYKRNVYRIHCIDNVISNSSQCKGETMDIP
jgi:hypothetical protein